ncbi:peptidoglycan-binding protein [Mycolicibacterium sp.]|uniref:peptidoglycan-binding domain-containing protein n=1 Tax=Mycolicibacterium sp. TaxID=2320850 RepID=UPI00355EECC8
MTSRLAAGLLALAVFSLPAAASAGDAEGSYIVRGIGARPCADYVQAVSTSPEAVKPFVSWMEGYLSGLNRLQPETFDITPLTSSAVVGQLVRNHCAANGTLRFETAVAQLMEAMSAYKVSAKSQLIEMTLGDAQAAVRQSTLLWMQQHMKEQGLFRGTPDGLFGADSRQAFLAYQKKHKLKETGVPDATTLVHFMQAAAAKQ